MEEKDLLDEIAERTEAIIKAESERTDLVKQARAAGYTWRQIGTWCGTTPQGAQKRYGHL